VKHDRAMNAADEGSVGRLGAEPIDVAPRPFAVSTRGILLVFSAEAECHIVVPMHGFLIEWRNLMNVDANERRLVGSLNHDPRLLEHFAAGRG